MWATFFFMICIIFCVALAHSKNILQFGQTKLLNSICLVLTLHYRVKWLKMCVLISHQKKNPIHTGLIRYEGIYLNFSICHDNTIPRPYRSSYFYDLSSLNSVVWSFTLIFLERWDKNVLKLLSFKSPYQFNPSWHHFNAVSFALLLWPVTQ